MTTLSDFIAAININGTMTTFANGLITIHMKRI